MSHKIKTSTSEGDHLKSYRELGYIVVESRDTLSGEGDHVHYFISDDELKSLEDWALAVAEMARSLREEGE